MNIPALSQIISTAYVLNLPRRADRKARFQADCKRHGLADCLDFVWIEAVDGRALPKLNLGATPNESAATIGHRRIWHAIASGKQPCAVFEDDAFFCSDFGELWHSELEIPVGTDFLGLGLTSTVFKGLANPIPGLRKPHAAWGLFAAIIWPEGAIKLLESECKNPFATADHFTRKGFEQGWLSSWTVYPYWCVVYPGPSDIADHRPSGAQRFGDHFRDALPT